MRAFRVTYDGRPYHGFQRQPDVPTVEGTLFDALRELGAFDGDKPPGYAAAGRTDAGASALAQTVAFDAPDWLSPAALNSRLPGDVRAWAAAAAPADFHATHDAARRAYVYFLYAPAAEVNDDDARTALTRLAGADGEARDYHNLTPDESGTVRDLSGALERDGDFLAVRVEAGGFARQLVRRLVSLVRAVGRGDAQLAKVDRVLDSEPMNGPEGVPPAPPTPLVLVDVSYPDLSFSVDAAAAESARAVFEERRVDGLVAARVAGRIRSGVSSR